LYVNVYRPQEAASGGLPALVLVPGGIADSSAFSGRPFTAPYLAVRGDVVVIFDADGRGRSDGEENYNGFIQQDGLAEVIRFTANLPEVDAGKIGLVSFSYGVTMASGALARCPDLPVLFFIDWVGPVNRYYTTTNCQPSVRIDWADCSDDAFWSEREAVEFIRAVEVPYQRLQSEEDHVQPNNNHAIDIINAANAGTCPWTRLNHYEPNLNYEASNPPAMIPENKDVQLRVSVGDFADELLEIFSTP